MRLGFIFSAIICTIHLALGFILHSSEEFENTQKHARGAAMTLSQNEDQRYARQTLLSEVGAIGQLRLKSARALIVGVGGLGNPVAAYLAAAGVGTIGLIDDDVVSLSNLQRQVLFSTPNIGCSKAEIARERLVALNPEITVHAYNERLDAARATALFLKYDLIIDATDNFSARASISRICLQTQRTHIFAGISKFEGQLAVFAPDRGSCYRCLVPELPDPGEAPNCAESGVIGAVAGIIGSMQALATIKIILNASTVPFGTLTVFEGGMNGSSAPELRSYSLSERAGCAHSKIRAHAFLANIEHDSNIELDFFEPEPAPRAELFAHDEWTDQRFWPTTPIWIDVRTLTETQANPVPGALEIPLALLHSRLSKLSRHANYIIFCQSGGRSQKAQDVLKEHGFSNVWNLRGGLNSNDLRRPEKHAGQKTQAERLDGKSSTTNLERV